MGEYTRCPDYARHTTLRCHICLAFVRRGEPSLAITCQTKTTALTTTGSTAGSLEGSRLLVLLVCQAAGVDSLGGLCCGRHRPRSISAVPRQPITRLEPLKGALFLNLVHADSPAGSLEHARPTSCPIDERATLHVTCSIQSQAEVPVLPCPTPAAAFLTVLGHWRPRQRRPLFSALSIADDCASPVTTRNGL